MWMDFALVALGLVLLTLGADWLVAGAARLALRVGISALVVGLTVVAFGTSLPEFLVSVQSAFEGKSSIAVGNVVGSNICNLALIVGVAALIKPFQVDRQVVVREFPWMLVVSLLLLWVLWSHSVPKWQAGILAAGLILYTWRSFLVGRQGGNDEACEQLEGEIGEVKGRKPMWMLLGLIVAGLVLLVVGANFLVDGAASLARRAGVSEAVIGLSLVAFGTSVPELATTVMAAIRGQSQIAIGNAVGSNLFNILFVIGVSGLVLPLPLDRGEVSNLDLSAMVAIVLITWAMIASKGRWLHRWEGALLIAFYGGYIGWLAMGAPGKDLF